MRKQLVLIILLLVGDLAKCTDLVCHAKLPKWKEELAFDLSSRQILVKTIYQGVNIILDKKDPHITGNVRDGGTYQGYDMRTFARFVKKGDVIINIGSNIGLETIVYGKIVGPTGKIFFFEPYSVSHALILSNVYLNKLEDIATVYKVGISNTKMIAYILVSYQNTSASQIHTEQTMKAFPYKPDEKEKIQVDLLDNVLPNDVKVDFALIDVERVQIQCMEGMKQTILRSPDMILVVEWAGYSSMLEIDEYYKRMKALLFWFQEQKYKFYITDREATLKAPDSCIKEHFTVMDAQQLYDYTLKKVGTPDVIFAPGHIDPNQLQ